MATTRPETILGDTAVAVHPDDERYERFVGKTALVPILDRKIPVIADSYEIYKLCCTILCVCHITREEDTFGAPRQLIFIPTTSSGENRYDHAFSRLF